MTEPSLERIIPDATDPANPFDLQSLRLHVERYRFAAGYLTPGRLLDLACGVGYGSAQLHADHRLTGATITAVDNDPTAIAYAVKHYENPAIDFRLAGADSLAGETMFDGIVSLETIEHLPDPAGFAGLLFSLLKPGGVLVISAPVTPSMDGNPYHLSDFTPGGFRQLFRALGLKEIASLRQQQPYSMIGMMGKKKNGRLKDKRAGLLGWYWRHPRKLLTRLWSLATAGPVNRYLTLVLKK